jgi:hypothetical protein
VREKERTTIALLGTDTVVGQALSLLLQGEGYEIRMVEAPRRADRRIRWREWTCS